MTRFIALVWDDRDAEGLQQALTLRQSLTETHRWTALTDRAGLSVYVPSDDPSMATFLDHHAGVILGTVFERASSSTPSPGQQTRMSAHQTYEILHTQGRSLIGSHWGAYVLFLRGPEKHRVRVLRSPAGSLPCYYLTHERLTILVTQVADLRWLCPRALSINWDSIRAQAAAGDYLTRETGLARVFAIISGECIDIYEGRITHRMYWNPATVCSEPINSVAEAATLLRQETHRCVRAWASRHKRVLLLLSGGLDSSIVLSCLHRATRVIAVNFHSPGAGDERRFARSMAARTQTPIEEIPSNLNIDLRDCLACALTPSPVLNFTAFDVEPVTHKLAQRWEATAVFTGETGDDVLGHAPAPEALSEILQHPGELHRFFGASLNYAQLARISVWQAMALAVQHLRWLHRIKTWSVYRHRQLAGHVRAGSLISDAAADQYEAMIGQFLHPWFQATEALPLGKVMLLYSLIKATSSVNHSTFDENEALPTIHPLVSQPLIETALRIRSDLHFYRAENGAVARAAFHEALSPEVLDRGIGKGTPNAWARSLLDNNATFLSSLLREGVLVEKGILDRAKLDALLSMEVNGSRIGLAELIQQVYIEIWVRRWAQAGAHL